MSVASVGFSPVSQSAAVEVRMQTMRQSEMQPDKVRPQIIQSTAADLQRISHAFNKKLQFEVDQRSNQVIVKVIDKETDKVIKELPPEELQRLHSNLIEAVGLFFDEMA